MATAAAAEPSNTIVEVHENSRYPEKAWNALKKKIKLESLQPLPLDTPIFDDKIRFVCISDTHNHTDEMQYKIPKGDILIHAGDFSRRGREEEVVEFSRFLGTLNNQFKHKLVIAGNHELTFPTEKKKKLLAQLKVLSIKEEDNLKKYKAALTNCVYLEDSGIELYGIKIYGSPWQPTYRGWAFNADRGEDILKIWNKIPDETDVLITHGPPLGIGDLTASNTHVGCCELLSTIRSRVKPQYHIFGHVHEGHGIWTDSSTTYINASICNNKYRAINPPIIFDMPIPNGFKKD